MPSLKKLIYEMITVIAITSNGCFHFLEPEVNFDECWNYIGPAYWIDGYPIIHRHNKNWIASRFVWYFFTHHDCRGKEVHHKCKIRACVNPFHLEELTSRKHRYHHNRKVRR